MSATPKNTAPASPARAGPRWFRSLRVRLLISVNLAVALGVIGAIGFDYRKQLAAELSAHRTDLSDEARTLLPAVQELRRYGPGSIQRYIDTVCATMQDESSPGHHIAVDIGETTIQAQSHHRASEALLFQMKTAAASPDGQSRSDGTSLIVGHARDGEIRVFVAERAGPVIARIRSQEILRLGVFAGIVAISALIVNMILLRLVTRPIGELVQVVRQIGAGDFRTRPGRFKTEEFSTLAAEIARMGSDLERRERDRAAHLQKARLLQEHLLPHFKSGPVPSSAVVYRPADTVAGDYYDLLPLSDGSLLACMADVCGHGVPAAMGAAILKTLVFAAAERSTSPAAMLRSINERFLRVSLPGDFASMVLVRIVATSGAGGGGGAGGVIEYASAGHEPCFLLRASGTLERLDQSGILLGISQGEDWVDRRLDVSPADLLVLLTDGVTEAMDATRRQFGRERLVTQLAALAGSSPGEIARSIVAAVDLHCGHPSAVADDQTLVVLDLHALSVEWRTRAAGEAGAGRAGRAGGGGREGGRGALSTVDDSPRAV